ncbi:MAG TPA: glycosyltransferase family 39 protein [Candidatus Dojkabacteria bacterium]|jgi:4-amino-4-deoxy-L-arabinose transferase-like glycosyltransferase
MHNFNGIYLRIKGKRLIFCVVFAVLILFSFLYINRGDVEFWDEATNLVVIVESEKTSDLLDLKFNDTYFWEKPPSYYYIGIVILKLFSLSVENLVTSMRIISAVFGILTILSVYLVLSKKISSKAGFFSVLFFLSVPSLWLMNPSGTLATHNFRSADSDAMQLFFITVGSLLAIYYPRKYLLPAVFAGIALMTKGPMGFLPIVIQVGLFIVQYNQKTINSKEIYRKISKIIMILLIIIVPWHLYMTIKFGMDFWDEYLIYHILNRSSSALEGNSQPVWFYLKFLINPQSSGILLWVLASLIIQIKNRRFTIFENKELIIASGLLILISMAATKLSWYSLITIPFFVIYLAKSWDRIVAKSSFLKYLFLTILLVQILFVFLSILTLKPGVQNFVKNSIDSHTLFMSEREPHRVFKFFEIMNEGDLETNCDIEFSYTDRIIYDSHEYGFAREEFKITENYSYLDRRSCAIN